MKTMGFGQAIKTCFSKYATFQGRARRSEYWYFQLLIFIIGLVIGWVPILGQLVLLAFLLPNIAVSVRRLHDIGRSGWFFFLSIIPLVGAIILLIWYCTDSQPGANNWGANPKE